MGYAIESTDSGGAKRPKRRNSLDKQCQTMYHRDMPSTSFAPKIPGVLRWEHFYQAVYDIPQMVWSGNGPYLYRGSWRCSEYLTEGPDEALVQILYFFYRFPVMATREAIRAFAATTYLKNLNDEQIDKLHARAFNKVAEDSVWPKAEVYSYLRHPSVRAIISDTNEARKTTFYEVSKIAGRGDWNMAKDYVEEQYQLGKYAQALKSLYKTIPLKVQLLALSTLGRLNGASMTKREYIELARSCGNSRNTALKYLDDILYRMQITIDSSNIINPERKIFILK